ncbi:type II toxin-antitoxin system VapB family antitoxin [Caulobacter sp. 73W]|uniref:Type II toxin-antitoxin system VapB family antitoxin n=1 Tax=Caulobacter sp. 73W TaxID=3161137 RepID=A0AB39KY46_9CAUL
MEVIMVRTSLFLSNRSQAVRLPRDVAFPEGVSAVTIVKEGKKRIIMPANAAWDDFFDEPGIDLGPRMQPSQSDRETF